MTYKLNRGDLVCFQVDAQQNEFTQIGFTFIERYNVCPIIIFAVFDALRRQNHQKTRILPNSCYRDDGNDLKILVHVLHLWK